MISFNYVSPYTFFQHAVIQSVKNIGEAIVPYHPLHKSTACHALSFM